jgi:hypothetical protein
MDGLQISGWTRRRFERVIGGIVAAASGLAGVDLSEAKKKRKRKRKKKKRCLKVQASCTAGGKKKCCKGLSCDEVIDLAGTFCCRLENADCSDAEDCCFPNSCFIDPVSQEGFCKLA